MEDKRLISFWDLLDETDQYESKNTPLLFKQTKEVYLNCQTLAAIKKKIPKFGEHAPRIQLKHVVQLVSRIMFPLEVDILNRDLITLGEKILATITGKGRQDADSTDSRENLTAIKKVFETLHRHGGCLTELLVSIPFQIFIFVAGADGNIDVSERSCFLSAIQENAWCQSDISREILIRSTYSFGKFEKQFSLGKLKKNFNAISSAMHMAETFFTSKELDLLRVDFKQLGREIASSSGGISSQDSISKEELRIIKSLDVFFTKGDADKTEQSSQMAVWEIEDDFGPKLRNRPRIYAPQLEVSLKGVPGKPLIKPLNIALNSILCRVELKENHFDYFINPKLELKFPTSKSSVKLPPLYCKIIRFEAIYWNNDLVPLVFNIVWQFNDMTEETKERLKELLPDLFEQDFD